MSQVHVLRSGYYFYLGNSANMSQKLLLCDDSIFSLRLNFSDVNTVEFLQKDSLQI